MKLVLATGNQGKLAELRQLLEGTGIQVLPQSDFGVPDAEETGLSFIENAILKARHAAAHTGLPAMADDSGIEVDALNGAPGIYSARYAGVHGDDAANNARLLAALEGLPTAERGARFYCAVAFLRHAEDPTPVIAEGIWEGRILESARGEGGFGYDPLFFDPALDRSAAELDPAEKNRVSHRARALRAIAERLRAH
ncbi:MAG: RdgB/HAM1 family non-canonical purine NTP pyrophosphatase [Chromatiales bacterium]|nr:RdgB/HAM1 family non-canonical purine NTP pyrophosphatase [Chromatiales bacterium]